MPPLVRRFLKTAIGFLILGVALGVYMLARRELAGVWPTPWWRSAHTHAILVGLVMMMIMGVALWMFPRPARTTPSSIRGWLALPTGSLRLGPRRGWPGSWPGPGVSARPSAGS